MCCPICCSSEFTDRASLEKRLEVVGRLHATGIKKIMFSGGEPLLLEGLPTLMQHAKERGLKVGLSTNGLLLSERKLRAIAERVDEISLPLDGWDDSTHEKSRGRSGHFAHVVGLLAAVRSTGIAVDVGTVVSRFNHRGLRRIGRLLVERNVPKWKLFQYWAHGNGREIRHRAAISREDFDVCASEAQETFRGLLSIDTRTSSLQMMRSYLDILPSGDIIMPSGHGYTIIGNVLTETNLLSLLRRNNFNFEGHSKRHRRDRRTVRETSTVFASAKRRGERA
jgi:MoaA/NifB/PqqE/SkfB family radical SAM enzyme